MLMLTLLRLPIINCQLLDAFRMPPDASQARLASQPATLLEPILDWDEGQSPRTLSSTSHYRAFDAAAPGAFAVMRREPRLLPAHHLPRADHGDAKAIDPTAATRHRATASSGDGTAWITTQAQRTSSVNLSTADWPLPQRTQAVSAGSDHRHSERELSAAAAEAAAAAMLTEEAEWGAAPLPAWGQTDGLMVDGHSAVGEMTSGAVMSDAAAFEAAATSSDSADSVPARADGSVPRLADGGSVGKAWWDGERLILGWRRAGMARRQSRPQPLGSVNDGAAVGEGGAATEAAEWRHVGADGEGTRERRAATDGADAAVDVASAVALAEGWRELAGEQALPVGLLGGLSEGELGAVYAVDYGAQVPPS